MSNDVAVMLKEAFAHHQRSEWDPARALYEEILQIDPMHFDALQLLGTIEAQSGSKQRALELLTHALTINQTNPMVFLNQGFVMNDLGLFEQAVSSFEEVIKRSPDSSEAYFGRGNALKELGDIDLALSSYQDATRFNPRYAQAFLNAGVVQKEMYQLPAALVSYKNAIEAKPDYEEAFCNKGVIHHALKQFQEALDCYEKALSLKPDNPEARWNKSLTCLMLGDFEQGWPLYESRWQRETFSSVKREFTAPRWTGDQSLKDKTILLYGEQGLGDIIQFCRYVAAVAALGAKVVLEVPQPLVELCKTLEGLSAIVTYGLPLPEVDFQCPLMSLPFAFGTSLSTIPCVDSYLRSDATKVADWQNRLGKKTAPRVGVVWSSISKFRDDAQRSLTLSQFIEALPTEGFEYLCLQKEIKEADKELLAARPDIRFFGDFLHDLSDTAALIACTDLIVSTCTSVPHLSAALGKPTWLLLSFNADWRWHQDRHDSPWYASAKLFRQERAGDWVPVLNSVRAALTRDFSLASQSVHSKFQQAFNYHQHGDFDAARSLYLDVLHAVPDYFEALQLLGTLEAQTGRREQALVWFEQALAINQSNPIVWNNHGNVLNELERNEEAFESYTRAITLDPQNAHALNNRGMVCKKLNRLRDALKDYGQAVQIQPDFSQAYNNKAIVLRELMRFEEALASYDTAIKHEPNNAQFFYNRGLLLKTMGLSQEALDSFNQAIALNRHYAGAYLEKGVLLQGFNQLAPAIESYEIALSLNPQFDFLEGILLQARMYRCDWDQFDKKIHDLNTKIAAGRKVATPFSYLSLNDSLSLQSTVARTWTLEKYPANDTLGPIVQPSKGPRIKLGYYSADFHNHATAYLMAQLFELHDKQRFELIAFSFGPLSTDAMRTRLLKCFDQFIEVGHLSDIEVAQRSRAQGIQIAIDLKGYTGEARPGIFACRAAPIQVSYIGYPGTMGADYMDYLVADSVLIPEANQPFYTEKIVYMPDSYQVNDRSREIASSSFTRTQLGLPETGFVYCCFNNNYKITPATFDSWMRILKQVPGSVLWLLEDNPDAAVHLRTEAGERGIDPARLIFAPRMPLPEHLARHRLADLFLDTLPYNAHTTTSDALWAELPVLTCPGESFASRVAASLLTAVGLPELIVQNQMEYERAAVGFAKDLDKLHAVKSKLSKNRLTTSLFDSEKFTRHLESSYLQMMSRYESAQPTDHIYVA